MATREQLSVFRHIDMSGGADACWPFTRPTNSEGRPYVTVEGKKVRAYRLVYELVKGESLGKRVFRHKCDNPKCCNPNHGIAGTHEENMDDMKSRERHGLPHHTVRGIRKLLAKGTQTQEEIAELYGISRTAVSEIKSGRNYSHVTDEVSTDVEAEDRAASPRTEGTE